MFARYTTCSPCHINSALGFHTSSATEHKIESYIRNYIKLLEEYPNKKQRELTSDNWFRDNYKGEISELDEKMERFPELRDALSKPLSAFFNKRSTNFETMFRQKLLLRDNPLFSEFPKLVNIVDVREELDLPSGYEIDQEAVDLGIYTISKEGRDILDKSRKLYVVGLFKIDEKSAVEQKFELDFLMSCPKYAEACRLKFKENVIDVNIAETWKAFRKHQPALEHAYDSVTLHRT